MGVSKTKSPSRKAAATVAPIPAQPAAATDGDAPPRSNSSSPARPLPPKRAAGAAAASSPNNNTSRIGLIISALAVLGLVTVGDLMVLPILTNEAAKASEAAMAPFRVRTKALSHAQIKALSSSKILTRL